VGAGSASAPTGPLVLSVGRLSPHKRPDLVLRTFELYRSACAETARLEMVGEPLSPAYERELRALAGPGVTIHGRLEQDALNELWRDASVFITLSEHEGFCVPLLEAFATDTPVIARPVGGMREVGGNAVLWAADHDLAVIAEMVDLAVRDGDLRATLVERGRKQLDKYAPEVALAALREAVDAALSLR
jgi:glycosyltransferase involved in cell wall biosynthesis